MKTLATDFTQNGFTFTQIKREGNLAIYKRKKPDWESEHYEVVRVKSHNGYEIAGVTIPPGESYPGPTTWGVDGFTVATEERANEKFKEMQEKQLAADLNPVKRGRKPGAK